MKIFLLCLINLILFLKSTAQPNYFSVANQQGFYSITNKVIQATSEKYLTIGNYYNFNSVGIGPFATYPHIGCIDDNNNIVWNISPAFSYEHSDVSDIIKTADGKFVYIDHSELCDVGGVGIIMMEKIDSMGNNIWSKSYQYISFYNSNQHLIELPNGDLLFTLDNKVIFTNNFGDSLTSLTLSAGEINSASITPDNYLLFGCDSGFVKTDLAGITVLTGFQNINIKNLIVKTDNQYIFSSSDIFYRTDSLFSTLDSIQLSNWYDNITAICPFGNNFLVMAHSPGPGTYDIVFLDGNFFQIPTVWINSPDWIINSIIPSDSGFVIAGDEKTYEGQHCFVKSYGSNFQTSAEKFDAGVVDVKVDSMIAHSIGIQNIYNITFNAYATIKNFGPDTIHDFAANIYIYQFFTICIPYAITKSVHNINLAPQDTMSIYMGTFSYQFPLTPTQPYNLCLFSSSPNNHIDSNHSNDKFCKAIPVTYVGIEENNMLNDLQISPNPTLSSIRINIPELKSPVNISLSDISGKEINKGIIDKTISDLSLINLTPGMYFLKFNFANQSVVKKIIKL